MTATIEKRAYIGSIFHLYPLAMAILRSSLGPITQSFGNLTTAKWKDKTVLKQKVPANNTSNSFAQSQQRDKFADMAKLGAALGALIRVGFRTAATSMTELNVFQSRNKGVISNSGGGGTIIVYDDIVVSAGSLTGVVGLVQAAPVGASITLTWDDNSGNGNAMPDDRAYAAILYRGDNTVRAVSLGEVKRSAKSLTLTDPTGNAIPGVPCATYIFFRSATSSSTSPSAVHLT